MFDVRLSEFPEIEDLLKILEENGLFKQMDEVSTLVHYVEHMEDKLSEMSTELRDMHDEVTKIRDSSIKAKCTALMATAEERFNQVKHVVTTCKNNLLISAHSAITAFKEKGKDTLVSAVTAMRIPSALDAMKNTFSKAAESMRGNAEKLDAFRDEFHEVGFHLKNMGRALFGKPVKESEALKHDKGILAKVRSFMQKTADRYEDMGKGADKLSTKVKERYDKQKSVKSELKSIKAAQKAEMVKRVPMKEKVL